ncbi:MAG: tyrosine-type recombinase/integrase [Chloroflexota bacterium]
MVAIRHPRWQDMDHSQEPLYDFVVLRNATRATGPIADFFAKKDAEREHKTVLWYQESLMAFWQFLQTQDLGLVGDLNETTVNQFRVHLRLKGLAENTISNRLRAIRAFAYWLREKGWTQEYVLTGVKIPQSTRPQFGQIEDGQRKALFDLYNPGTFLGSRNLAMLGVLSDTGLRREEVVNLQLKNADLETGVLKVYADKTEEWRYLPLTTELIGLLKNYLKWREKYFNQPSRRRLNGSASHRAAGSRTVADSILFPAWNGNVLKPQALGLILYRASQKLGFRLHAHSFRHDFITRKALDGENPSVVKRWAGHRSYAMTDYYFEVADHMLGAIQPKHSVLASITLPGTKQRGRPPKATSA